MRLFSSCKAAVVGGAVANAATSAKEEVCEKEVNQPSELPGSPSDLMPTLYLNHGGGPMPVLGQQPEVAEFLKAYGNKFNKNPPEAVVVVTAHWEDSVVSVSTGSSHSLMFDYSGFPSESYRLKYPAPGHPKVANEVLRLLKNAGISARGDDRRGWDHGTFIPLLCMFPKAEIPVVQVSLVRGQDAKQHLAIGAALRPLRERNVLIVGSGASFHNMMYFFSSGGTKKVGQGHATAWAGWLQKTVTDPALSAEDRMATLANWHKAPSAYDCQPRGRAEHLMPLFVIAGTALGQQGTAVGEKYNSMMGLKINQFEWTN